MMQVGMLWFDNTPRRSFDDKIERGVRYYRSKYGHLPNICYVHPASLQQSEIERSIRVATAPSMLPHHFWFGVSREDSTVS